MITSMNCTPLPSPEASPVVGAQLCVFLQDCLKYMLICWTLGLYLNFDQDAIKKLNLRLPLHFLYVCISLYIDIFLIYHHGFWYSLACRIPCIVMVQRAAMIQEKSEQARPRVPVVRVLFLSQRSFVQQRLLDIERYFVSNTKLQSSYLERDKLGWIVPKPELNQDLGIAELKGFIIDWSAKDCPCIKLYYKPAEKGNGLLSVNDIKTLLQLDSQELRDLSFSLDRPHEVVIDGNANLLYLKQLSTIYEKVCTPKKLANTGIMETFFYADYFMKFLAVGSEVSANFPFDTQPISHLIQHLPKELQHSLRSVRLRELQESQCVCRHRFWIEIEQLNFQSCISDDKEYFYINSVETKVNTESLGPCPTRSACKSFADDLTRHYPEVSQHFKMFARLPELAKLQFVLIKAKEQLAAKGYSLLPIDTWQGEIPTKPDLVPSSWSSSFSVSGGVQSAPTYNQFPYIPTVDDSATYEHARKYGLSSLTQLAQTAREGPGGIRLQPQGVPDHQSNGSLSSLFDIGNGLLSLELAMIALVIVQRSNKKND